MKLEAKEIAVGKYIGQELWVCDYRYDNFGNKPIRHVRPTKVNCVSIDETNKRVNYSECFFREGDKKSSLIKLYDNTGYRTFPGIPLQSFTTEQECRKAYDSAKKKLREEFQKYKDTVLYRLEELEKELI